MSHSSNSSLLQQHRPESLPPQLPDRAVAISHAQAHWLETHEHTQQLLCKSRSRDLLVAANKDSTFSSRSSFSQLSSLSQPVASSSAGLKYLSVEPTSEEFVDHAVADVHSRLSDSSENIQSCASLLANAQVTAIGEAMSKERWQPDESSALCTFPLCTANFAQSSYFFLRHRRHHCRLCGQLFCGTHSAQRAPLIHSTNSGRAIVHARVCDMCLPRPESSDAPYPTLSQPRKISSSVSEPLSSDASILVTPSDDDVAMLSSNTGSSILRASTIAEHASVADVDERLAPIEDWMDRSGVLSLYPLAVKPSHSRSKRSSSPAPSVAPLFAPSLKYRRAAKENELARQTLRQRRLGKDDFWLPENWGYKREDFDPTCRDDESGKTVGGVVEDGPIRFRTRVVTPLATPLRV
ncbi:hypothetical protein I308_105122 [Cryptococcus tetragattii IND107]|uniref:FYVE-type domain-containing protein n=1 Tax=Cryptococcus tetragattii IND107 TaxID=1296105 RepID=A0ABR3BMJ0_9TREE|nr:hypothetical protein I308_01973 [Cryptococcus tetragattii IND107]